MKRAFALIYVVLFTGLISIVVATIAGSLAANIRLTAKTAESAQAYQLARSGIEDALARYQMNPPAACRDEAPVFVVIDSNDPSRRGEYHLTLCNNYVQAVGIYKNSQMTLQARIGGNINNHDVSDNGEKIYQIGN